MSRVPSAARLSSVLVGVLACLIAGCARIPTDGPVVAGRQAGTPAALHAIVPGPSMGATPYEIVDGFLRAMISADKDFGVARSFLSPAEGEGWNPDAQTLFYDGSYTIRVSSTASPGRQPATEAPSSERATVTLKVVQKIDADGRLEQLETPRRDDLRLELARVEGQWRITDAPDLAAVAVTDRDFVFNSYNLYYVDATGRYLVPDPRWLPETAATSTRLVTMLLTGPPRWLQSSVTTAFPRGTRLAAPSSVVIDDGVAAVELSPQARPADRRRRGLMRAQLLATLQPLADVDDVSMRVDGAPLDAGPVSPVTVTPVDPSPVALRDGRLVRFNLDGEDSGEEITAARVLRDADALAVDYTGQLFAVRTGEGSQLRLAGRSGTGDPVLTADELTAPSFDVHGWVWSTDVTCNGTVTAVSPQGVVLDVPASWLAGRHIDVIRVARDGVRVLIASTSPDGTAHVELAAISRRADGIPTGLTVAPGDPLGVGIESVRDAVWLGPVDLALIARRPGVQGLRILPIEVGGPPHDPMLPLTDPRQLAGAQGVGSVLVLTGSHDVMTQAGAQWISLPAAAGAEAVAYAG